jgi:hypothetical protein
MKMLSQETFQPKIFFYGLLFVKKSIQAWDIYSVQAKNFAIKIYSENFGEYINHQNLHLICPHIKLFFQVGHGAVQSTKSSTTT